MAVVDFWPSEEGLIVPGLDIGFMTATAAVAEGAPAKMGTPSAGVIAVTTAAAIGDAWCVALKAIGAGAMGPVCLTGIMKMTSAQTAAITAGEFVMNSSEAGVIHETSTTIAGLVLFGGSSYVLGLALQTTTVKNDEILIWIGKTL